MRIYGQFFLVLKSNHQSDFLTLLVWIAEQTICFSALRLRFRLFAETRVTECVTLSSLRGPGPWEWAVSLNPGAPCKWSDPSTKRLSIMALIFPRKLSESPEKPKTKVNFVSHKYRCIINKISNKITTLDSASMKCPGYPELMVNILVVTVQRLVFNLTFAKVALPLCFFFFILLLHPHTEIQVFIFTVCCGICNLNPRLALLLHSASCSSHFFFWAQN